MEFETSSPPIPHLMLKSPLKNSSCLILSHCMLWGELDWYMHKENKLKLDHHLTPYTRINSKWEKDLNISHDTIRILKENIGSKISDTLCSSIFANISPRPREIKEKINKWDYITLKSFCTAKETIIRMKMVPIVWENIFALIHKIRV